MSTFNNNRFTPGNKANLRAFINKSFISQYYHGITIEDQLRKDYLCKCIQPTINTTKQGWNDPSQTQNNRISQILTGTLGGRTTFGNANKPAVINYLGGWEGQPGGILKPPRNKF